MSERAKGLGLLEALPIGVGTTIGADIFVLPGSAAEAGLLARGTGDVGPPEVVKTVDASVLPAEQARDQSLKERLLGSRTKNTTPAK
jgi:hypothetical protein